MLKRKKVKSMLIASMAASMVLVSACGQASDDTNNAGNADGTGGDTGAQETITLSMMHPWTSPNPDNDVYNARIESFQAEHPNIKIVEDEVAAEQYKTKLFTLATGNNLADINVVWPGADLEPLVSGNLLMSLNDHMDNWNGLVREGALVGFNPDGNQYAIPTKQNFTDIIYYNSTFAERK